MIFSDYDITNLIGLRFLKSITGELIIMGNDSLTSLTGLDSLTNIGSHLRIGYYFGEAIGNISLSSITGLHGVTSIGGDLEICGNSSLINLNGLDNIEPESIFELFISNNDLLSSCEAQSVCNYLASSSYIVAIHENTLGCNSIAEVKEACETVSIKEMKLMDLKITPNPFNNSTTISYNLPQQATVQISIFNHLGKQVDFIQQNQSSGKQQITWDASGLPSGVYYFRMQAGEQVASGKLLLVK